MDLLYGEGYSIGKSLFIIQRYFKIFLNHKVKKYGLNGAQSLVLHALMKEDGLSQEEINEGLQFDKGFLAKVAKSLEKEGYIIRKVNQEDRRAYKLFLTHKGKGLKPIILEILNEWDSTILEGVTEEKIDIFENILNGMLKGIAIKCKEVKEGK